MRVGQGMGRERINAEEGQIFFENTSKTGVLPMGERYFGKGRTSSVKYRCIEWS